MRPVFAVNCIICCRLARIRPTSASVSYCQPCFRATYLESKKTTTDRIRLPKDVKTAAEQVLKRVQTALLQKRSVLGPKGKKLRDIETSITQKEAKKKEVTKPIQNKIALLQKQITELQNVLANSPYDKQIAVLKTKKDALEAEINPI